MNDLTAATVSERLSVTPTPFHVDQLNGRAGRSADQRLAATRAATRKRGARRGVEPDSAPDLVIRVGKWI